MIFKDNKHELFYNNFLVKANVKEKDFERKSLFYLLALFTETRGHINDLYDFKNNWIKFDGLNKGWQTGGTSKITKLAFNLYNGYHGENGEDFSPLTLFSVSEDNRIYLLEAIKLRFN